MALTPDFDNLIIYSDASITDAVAFHDELRDIEASDEGMLFPVIHTYKELPLGGGAIFPAVAFINSWTLQLPVGNWTVSGGNITAMINPVAGCYVERIQSAAYAVSSALGGSTGPTAAEIAMAVWMYAERTLTAASSSSLTTEEHNKLMAVPTALENALAHANRVVENNLTNEDLIKLKASVLLGKVTGAGTGTEKFRDLTDSKDRVTATIDSSGNRTVVVLDAA